MNNGTVKFFNTERGFGYIEQEESTVQYRVLHASLARAGIKRLSDGQKVRFDTHTDPHSGKITVNNIEAD